MDSICSIETLIDGLGGTKAVAEWLRLHPSAVSKWKERGEIPPAWHLRLVRKCERLGLRIDEAAVFGPPPEEGGRAA